MLTKEQKMFLESLPVHVLSELVTAIFYNDGGYLDHRPIGMTATELKLTEDNGVAIAEELLRRCVNSRV